MSGSVISMVTRATATETRDISVERVLEGISTGGKNLKGQIQQIRNRFEAEMAFTNDRKKAKLAVDPLKKQLPGVIWSGTFSQRANDKLMKHSGLLCADLDSLGAHLVEVRKKLAAASPHAVAVFLSPSGDGLKVIFRVAADASRHAGSFRAVEKHVRDLTGFQVDQACKDPARLCFMSHDPQLYVNERAIAIEPLPEPEKPKLIPSNGAVNLSERQHIAQNILGSVEWISETEGYCDCPNKAAHTTGDGKRDCKIWVGDKPTIYCFHNSCRGVIDGLNHALRSRIGRAEFVPTPRIEPQPDNGESVELPSTPTPYVPPPLDLLPDKLQDYVHAAAESLNVDVAYPFLPHLSSLASAIGNARSIILKRGFVQPPVIWTGLVGPTGSLKSPGLEAGFSPVLEHERELKRQNQQAVELFEEDYARWKSENPKKRGPEPEKPVILTCLMDDLTIEVLSDRLATNPRGVLVAKDEISHWFASFDQYKSSAKGSDVSRWLSLDTAVFLAVDRLKDNRHHRIWMPRVCITGGIQPKVLRRILTEEFFERGLPARFLFAYPETTQPRWSEKTVSDELQNKVLESFANLWLLQPEHDEHGQPRPTLLRLDDEAKQVFVAFYNQCGTAAVEADEHGAAAWSKLSGYAARLALVGQLARNPNSETVTGDTMKAACELADWFGGEGVRIYSALAETPEQRERRELIEFIERRGAVVYERDVMQSFTRLKNNKPGTERELTALVKAGLGKWEPVDHGGGRGRPARKFHLLRLSTSTQFGDLRGKTGNSVDVDTPNSEKITPSVEHRFGTSFALKTRQPCTP